MSILLVISGLLILIVVSIDVLITTLTVEGAVWQIATAIASVNGFFLVTLAIAYLLPVVSAATQQRQLAVYLVGIGSHLANKDQPKDAIAQVPSTNPRIVMMHNPKSFPALPANTAPVAVAGHTHGGQIRLPFTPQWSWLALAKNWEHVDGWSDGYDVSGNNLYVNRGIGFSDLPIRLNCSPEVTLFTLQGTGNRE
ncbi:MAG: hypothetical protein RIG27_19410 [Coleofasciculus sp. F4-SAH-05]